MRAHRTKFFSGSKIKTLKALQDIVRRLKRQGKKIVFTNGCFDLLHYGHISYLENAKNKGDILIVAINNNASVRRIKGDKRPIINETDRARMLAALECVDYVILFKEDTPYNLINTLTPDILVKGADWRLENIVGRDIVLKYGGKATIIDFAKGYSTTKLIKRIAKKFV